MSMLPTDDYYPTFEITENDDGIRPAGKPDQCFYCMENIGSKHIKGCVITWRDKTVKLVATVQFDYQIPEHYDSDDIHWKFNEGTWCASNLADTFTEQDCGCSRTEVKEL